MRGRQSKTSQSKLRGIRSMVGALLTTPRGRVKWRHCPQAEKKQAGRATAHRCPPHPPPHKLHAMFPLFAAIEASPVWAWGEFFLLFTRGIATRSRSVSARRAWSYEREELGGVGGARWRERWGARVVWRGAEWETAVSCSVSRRAVSGRHVLVLNILRFQGRDRAYQHAWLFGESSARRC